MLNKYLEGMIIINKKIGLIILCLLIVLTGFMIQNPSNKKIQIVYLKPNEVIEKFFKYYNQKNLNGMNSLTTVNYHFSKLNWEFDNLKYIKVSHIVEDTNQTNKEIYIRSRKKNQLIDMEKEKTELENVTIFKVSFEVKYKKDGIGPRDSGKYGYNYTLIRKNKNSPWLISSAGY